MDPDQTAPKGADRSGSTLFVCMLKLVIAVSIYMQKTTSAENIFKMIFFIAGQGLSKVCARI